MTKALTSDNGGWEGAEESRDDDGTQTDIHSNTDAGQERTYIALDSDMMMMVMDWGVAGGDGRDGMQRDMRAGDARCGAGRAGGRGGEAGQRETRGGW